MSTYVIGDLHGCADELKKLLLKLRFNERRDTLWFTGDLINRGPQSLETLRLVRNLGDAAITVLGNHDLHLLGCWAGVRTARDGDTVEEILTASDGDELCHWLRTRPILHRQANKVLVHAGLYPRWSIATAEARARNFESHLSGDNYRAVIESIFDGKTPIHDRDSLSLPERLQFSAAVFTRMRFVNPQDASLNMREKGPPETRSEQACPWFEAAGDRFKDYQVFTGHWAALGHRQGDWLTALDSGCMWGGALTAVSLAQPSQSCCVDCSHLREGFD